MVIFVRGRNSPNGLIIVTNKSPWKSEEDSIVRNQRAPLLLDQSVLGRLGKIEIDNAKQVLKITHEKP